MNMKALEAAVIMNGQVNEMPDNLVFTGVSTDTRTISDGNIFFAVKGENFDGADYVMGALERVLHVPLQKEKSMTRGL